MSGVPETILVVDDRPASRYATARIIRQGGFKVVEAGTGTEALQFASQGCDLVVLDINLPDISGYDVCRQLRQQSNGGRIPVIHLSASFLSDEHKIRGLEAGADGYLTHPVDPLVLIASIKAFLRTRQIESDLVRSEAKFRAVFDRAQIGICLISQELIFLDVNPEFCRMLGIVRDDTVGKHGSAFVPFGYEQKILEISEAIERHQTWHGSLPLLRANGGVAELDWRISSHSDPGIRLAMVVDVTDKRRSESEREQLLNSERAARLAAERANRLKDEFLATLSHELRTPLNAIVGWTQVLKFRPPSAADLAEGLETIERNARAQAELINDLLDVSRIMSGKLLLDIQPLSPATVIRDSIAGALPAAEAKGVQVELRLSEESRTITGDATRLQQVIWNLVNNAVKFTPREGRVTIDLNQTRDCTEIRVTDTGQGIKPEFLPHLFERFRQEDATSTRNHGGLGLGLAIVKHLVELHGGTVAATSTGEGHGSQFIVRLPTAVPVFRDVPSATAEPSQGLPVTAGNSRLESLNGIRVVLVDDDQDARNVAIRVLREFGAEVAEASNVEQALSLVQSFAPHVLVSDIGMPNLDGYALIRKIRSLGHDEQQLPAIALTAFARSEDRVRALKEGYQLHLGKPIAPSDLVSAIGGLIPNGR